MMTSGFSKTIYKNGQEVDADQHNGKDNVVVAQRRQTDVSSPAKHRVSFLNSAWIKA